jgi:hypothetical protein
MHGFSAWHTTYIPFCFTMDLGTHMHTHTHTHTQTHSHTRAFTHTHTHTQYVTHSHMHIHTLTQAHTRTHTYTHSHTGDSTLPLPPHMLPPSSRAGTTKAMRPDPSVQGNMGFPPSAPFEALPRSSQGWTGNGGMPPQPLPLPQRIGKGWIEGTLRGGGEAPSAHVRSPLCPSQDVVLEPPIPPGT